MADVFISYKREEIAWAARVAQALVEEGFSAFYDLDDDGIHAGEEWDKRLEQELAAAKCCVVLWSKASVESANVRSEARRANKNLILVPARINACQIPLGLDGLQEADLSQWRGDRTDRQWRFLVDRGVARKLGRAGRPPAAAAPALSPGQGPAPMDAAAAWAVIEASLDPADYQHFIEAFRTDSLAFHSVRGAVARVKMLAEWAGLDQNSKEKIQAFAAKVGDFPALAAAVRGALKAWPNIRLLHVLKGHGKEAYSAAFSPDGSQIVTGSFDNTARLWDAETGALRAMLKGRRNLVNSAAFSPDGSQIVTGSGDRTARLWDAETGALRAMLKGHASWVRSAAFSPDGSQIVTGSSDNTARIWDAETGALRATLKGHEGWVNSAAFSPDGSQIVTGSSDETARIWDAKTGALRATLGHGNWVLSAAFSPDGSHIVTGSFDNTARIWDAETGALRATLKGHGGYVNSAAFSPDGSHIVTGSGDKTARIWDARTGALRATLKGHGGSVQSAAFSPDGSQIVTGSYDHTARIWDAETGALRATLGHGDSVSSAEFSPDGSQIVTASTDNTARLWALE